MGRSERSGGLAGARGAQRGAAASRRPRRFTGAGPVGLLFGSWIVAMRAHSGRATDVPASGGGGGDPAHWRAGFEAAPPADWQDRSAPCVMSLGVVLKIILKVSFRSRDY